MFGQDRSVPLATVCGNRKKETKVTAACHGAKAARLPVLSRPLSPFEAVDYPGRRLAHSDLLRDR
jgi:hypothetical protein